MNSLTVIMVLSVMVALSAGKIVKIKNGYPGALLVSTGEAEYTLAVNSLVVLNLPNEWSGLISALPLDSEITTGPKTKINISLRPTGDTYSISLLDGFNLAAKIVPNGSINCISSVCAADILSVCPIEHQVVNSTGAVAACQNSPLVMSTLCPLAIVDALSSTLNTQNCYSASGYMIFFI